MPTYTRWPVLAVAAIISIGLLAMPRLAESRTSVSLSIASAERALAISAIGITVPPTVNAAEGDSISIIATVGSGDPRSIITITLTGVPPGLNFATNTPAWLRPSATLSGSLGFQTAGTWQLHWIAFDQFGATDSKTTQLIIADTPTNLVLEARAFTSDAYRTIRLWGGKPTWCAQVEPMNEEFELDQIDLSTIRVSDARVYGTSFPASTLKPSDRDDQDRNGIEELTICVPSESFPLLFASVYGNELVPLAIEGHLLDGTSFRAEVTVRVIRSRIRTSVSPNPSNPRATLSVFTSEAGFVRVRLFDTSGRLVRTPVDVPWAAAGPHLFRLDGRDAAGRALGSGVYLYRVETSSGATNGRFAILK